VQAVVLAGGLATRMLPQTRETPKYLLPVAGRPFAAWQLERLAAAGYGEVVLCVAHLGEQIRAFVGDGSAFGLRAAYVDEGPARRGTGGALSLASEQGALQDVFLVTYGDSYLPFDYAAPLAALEAQPALSGVMAVFRAAPPGSRRLEQSNTALSADGRLVARYQKGADDPSLRFIDYGAMALRRRALAGMPASPTPSASHAAGACRAWGLEELQARLAAEGTLGALEAAERFHEVGSPAGLADLEAYLGRLSPGG
jgi:N-acetyl-alpha-D-muramate 1-phosphate uridylyltransferase